MDKTIPDRQCISCRAMKPKNELIRVVRTDTSIVLDRTGKVNGRGAYVCVKSDCIRSLVKHRGLDRSFKMHVTDDVYNRIIEEFLSEE